MPPLLDEKQPEVANQHRLRLGNFVQAEVERDRLEQFAGIEHD